MTESLSQKEIQVPLSDISLNPDDRWSGYISLQDTINYTTSIEGSIRSLLDETINDRSNKLTQQNQEMANVPNEKRPLIIISPNLVNKTLDIVHILKKLEMGNYQFLLCVYEESEGNENSKKPLHASGFRFSLFDSDIREIFASVDKEEYKYGYGIDLPARKGLKQVFVRVHSTDEETTNNLLKRIG